MRETIETWTEGRVKVALVFERERSRYIVEHYKAGKARRRVFSTAKFRTLTHAKKAGRIYAEELFAARLQVATDRPSTMAELFARYVGAMEGGWRTATRVSTFGRWRQFEAFVKPSSDPDAITADDLDRFHKALRGRERPISPNQVRQLFALVRSVYKLGNQRKWVHNLEPVAYAPRISKDERIHLSHEPAEYSPEEWRKILAVATPTDRAWWRFGVSFLIEGVQGQRVNAIRHLRWSDVDFEAGVITWPAQYQKQGRELVQPLLSSTRAALEIAQAWRAADGYLGPWVLYSAGHGGKGAVDPMAGPVVYGTLHSALERAEKLAGVPHLPYRGSHGGRRMAAENVYAETGDLLQAAAWIGDRDLKQLKAYLKRNEERMAGAAGGAERASAGVVMGGATKSPVDAEEATTGSENPSSIVPAIVPDNSTNRESGVVTGVEESHWSDLNRRPQGKPTPHSEPISSNNAGLRVEK